MTQVFSPTGDVIPVTKIQAGPCFIVQVKEGGKNNATAIQVGFDEVKEWRLKKPQAGHLKGLKPLKFLRDFIVDSTANLNRGDEIAVDTFVAGDRVEVVGESKGRGFAGVVKRHGFHGAPATHGHKHDLRAPGSIGAGGVQRVFKGMRMAGRMGGAPVTVKNLEIIEVHPESSEIFVKGAIPGGRNNLVMILGPGELKVKKEIVEVAPAEEVKAVEENTPAIETNATAEEAKN